MTYIYDAINNLKTWFFPEWLTADPVFNLIWTVLLIVWGFWFLDLIFFRPFRWIIKKIRSKDEKFKL